MPDRLREALGVASASRRREEAARGQLVRLCAEADALRVASGVLNREIDRDHAELRRIEDATTWARRELDVLTAAIARRWAELACLARLHRSIAAPVSRPPEAAPRPGPPAEA